MEIGKTLYPTQREEWRDWLQRNFTKATEIWLVFPNKASGKPRLSYNDAVEEALCFGWIDSTIKKYNTESSAQRFSPRNPKSGYSQPNKERLRWLMKENKLHPSLKTTVEQVLKEPFIFPPDILEAIKKDPEVWKNYQCFSPAYQRIRIAYIEAARKRPEEFKKRLYNFIEKTRKNKQIGFGGIEKYY
ncbi:MAG: YdeI/OmpD-associated family protein [Desulfobacteraceae bacterium]|nr:MAG: YdeI/OmpD-associated family protein [Desulfobacteraceae bacterium]